MVMPSSRRKFLALASATPFLALAPAALRAADALACYDPEALPYAQKSRRRSLGYVELSTDPRKHCGACSFFTASAPAGCGTCQILSGGPVRAEAVCTSFAAKAPA